ncbi:NfeD family protein [Brevibacillus centrosporus]|uniref:Membrane-bound serine protease (ClpP class) n=1 Tax=Brevibacillus centrosporus TaxID=54910 RepID=A0A1I3WCY1_9BACL|nr:nodulation protein NfeD [Brevibacillus centrosporus]SFK04637.1 membrane-bound serine protease (ClpP class) [Brevibacillus centrosporus]
MNTAAARPSIRRIRFWLSLLSLLTGLMMFASMQTAKAASYQKAFWIPVDNTIERGLESFLKRAFLEAEQQQADLVILDINTPGGEVRAAGEIGQLIREAPMHVVAYIDNQAFSAGTYIALNANEIVMTPGSSMGAATPIDLAGNAADIKVISAWSEQMQGAAKLNKRNPEVARAMVEIDTEFPGLKPKGTVLSLDAQTAQNVGYADRVVVNKEELFRQLGVNASAVQSIDPTAGERVARWVTSPIVMSLLLVIGLVGIVVELFAPGFGVAGTISLVAFGLYFFGHFVAGFANWLHIGLFVIGILLMIMEIFLPGGIVGALGFISIVTGLVMAAYDTQQGLASLGIAAVITVIVTLLLVKRFGVKGLFNKFILGDVQRNEEGYVAPKDQRELLNKEGIALTPLRPAGMVKVEGKRVDAVTVGGYVAAGTPVIVVQVEGTRVVVQEQELKE